MAETVAEVMTLARDVSQQQSTTGYTNATLLTDLNSFYQNQFHIDIGMGSITTMWNFQTLANVDEYAVSEKYRLINDKEVLMSGNVIDMYFDRVLFDQYFPDAYVSEEPLGSVTRTVTSEAFATGDGGAAYAATSTYTPIVAGSLTVDDTSGGQSMTDDGAGAFTGDGTGSVAYASGSISVTFNSNVTLGNPVTIDYQYTETGVGDGSTVTFTGTLVSSPVVKKSMVVKHDVETFKDVQGTGTLTGSLGGSGSIAYSSGAYSITFNTAPTDGQNIIATYAQYEAAQPNGVLYYDNLLKFRPIPDGTYDINIQVAERPTALALTSVLPNVLWGDALAYGTAMDKLNRMGNEEDALFAERQYKKKLGAILGHQYKIKSSTQRAKPRW